MEQHRTAIGLHYCDASRMQYRINLLEDLRHILIFFLKWPEITLCLYAIPIFFSLEDLFFRLMPLSLFYSLEKLQSCVLKIGVDFLLAFKGIWLVSQ